MDDEYNRILKEFVSKYIKRTFHKGEIIIFQGEAPRNTFIVHSGVVKAYNLSVHGDEKPVGFYTQFDSFPGTWIYDKVPSAIYYYEAFTTDCVLYLVPRDDYVSFVKTHPEMALAELDHYVNAQLGLSMQLNALQHSKANEKLMYTLHYLSITQGKSIGIKLREINLHLTHQDFANLTGLTRETAATELNKLKHLGVINYGKNQPYTVNLEKLQSILNDQYIAELEPVTNSGQ
jgi:CRP/FNR family cyclic AMP-dependent transcriptional regulator